MPMPSFTMRQLLEAGVHFGHHTRRWNPKMSPYIFGVRNKVHIIDLQQTVPMLHHAMEAVREVAARGGRILFVGTKRQASKAIAEAARRCGQYYVDHRWLGGMLTNWQTISKSITRLRELDVQLAVEDEESAGLTKKELLQLTRERDKLERALGGIKEMGNLPDILIIIDTNKEAIAVNESHTLKIPIVAVIDSNSNPDGIDFPIPGNDDSLRAINLYCDLLCDAVLDGLQMELTAAGGDAGDAEEAPKEALPEKATAAPEAPAPAALAPAVPVPEAPAPAVQAPAAPAPEAPAPAAPTPAVPAPEAPAPAAPAPAVPAPEAPAAAAPDPAPDAAPDAGVKDG